MLVRRLRRWPNIKETQGEHIVFSRMFNYYKSHPFQLTIPRLIMLILSRISQCEQACGCVEYDLFPRIWSIMMLFFNEQSIAGLTCIS